MTKLPTNAIVDHKQGKTKIMNLDCGNITCEEIVFE